MAPTDSPEDSWNADLLRNPHAVADKRRRVQQMFSAIAPSYDLNNRLHSLWMDQHWRRRAVKLSELRAENEVIDVACGTGDLSLCFADELARLNGKTTSVSTHVTPVVGIDFTYAMLPIARAKASAGKHHTSATFLNGDAQALPLPDGCADVVSIAFGIRNVQEPVVALREFSRILRPGGRMIILEFSLPTNRVLRALYNFYFRHILPRTATLISGDKTGAYRYLPESVNTFIGRDTMVQMLADAGFERVEQFAMTFGVCICYRGHKK